MMNGLQPVSYPPLRYVCRGGLFPPTIATLLCFLVLPVQAQDFTPEEVAKLKGLLPYVSVVEGEINGLKGPHLIIEGINVHIRSGSGATYDCANSTGLGNLVIGYNEEPDYYDLAPEDRVGSHNLIIGANHTYQSCGGLVAGTGNHIGGSASTVSGGQYNRAGAWASVSGGRGNK